MRLAAVLFLYIEQRCQGYNAPAEDFCCGEGRQGVYCIWLGYEGLQDVRAKVSYEIAEYVHHDDGGCSQVYVQSALGADDKSHCHREHSQEELILNAGQAAAQCHDCVQNGKNMYDPRGGKIAYDTHIFLKIDRS